MADISQIEYLRQVTLRKPDFQKALRRLQKQSPPPTDWECPSKGIPPEQWNKQKQEFLGHRFMFMEQWPFISPEDVGLSVGQQWPDRPRVYLVRDSPFFAPHPAPEGFIALHVHENTTGDELKKTWQRLKRSLPKTTGKVRHRSGSLQDRVKIWDLMMKEEQTFPVVARRLRKPLSTVKSLYWAIRWDILGPPLKERRSRSDRQAILIAQVDASDLRHNITCPKCSKAKTADEMCAARFAYVSKGQASMREYFSRTQDRDTHDRLPAKGNYRKPHD